MDNTQQMEQVKALQKDGLNCAQIVLNLSLAPLGEPSKELVNAFRGYAGGFSCGKTCGCLSGGAAALGVAVPQEGREGKYKSEELAAELCRWFENEFGSTDCSTLRTPGAVPKIVPCNELKLRTYQQCNAMMRESGLLG